MADPNNINNQDNQTDSSNPDEQTQVKTVDLGSGSLPAEPIPDGNSLTSAAAAPATSVPATSDPAAPATSDPAAPATSVPATSDPAAPPTSVPAASAPAASAAATSDPAASAPAASAAATPDPAAPATSVPASAAPAEDQPMSTTDPSTGVTITSNPFPAQSSESEAKSEESALQTTQASKPANAVASAESEQTPSQSAGGVTMPSESKSESTAPLPESVTPTTEKASVMANASTSTSTPDLDQLKSQETRESAPNQQAISPTAQPAQPTPQPSAGEPPIRPSQAEPVQPSQSAEANVATPQPIPAQQPASASQPTPTAPASSIPSVSTPSPLIPGPVGEEEVKKKAKKRGGGPSIFGLGRLGCRTIVTIFVIIPLILIIALVAVFIFRPEPVWGELKLFINGSVSNDGYGSAADVSPDYRLADRLNKATLIEPSLYQLVLSEQEIAYLVDRKISNVEQIYSNSSDNEISVLLNLTPEEDDPLWLKITLTQEGDQLEITSSSFGRFAIPNAVREQIQSTLVTGLSFLNRDSAVSIIQELIGSDQITITSAQFEEDQLLINFESEEMLGMQEMPLEDPVQPPLGEPEEVELTEELPADDLTPDL
ncbi:MAG: hypothetical protein ACOCXP_01025 [Candidatus Dojkabacteria bacterium]